MVKESVCFSSGVTRSWHLLRECTGTGGRAVAGVSSTWSWSCFPGLEPGMGSAVPSRGPETRTF